jgi:hypothetical protein
MTLEAIAALLGHRSLDMTLRYAKIANRTVADEYFAVTEKVIPRDRNFCLVLISIRMTRA